MLNFFCIDYFWLIAGILILFLELSSPGLFFFIAFAFGCFLVAFLKNILSLSLWWQCMTVLFGSFIFFIIIKRLIKTNKNKKIQFSNVDKIIGMQGIVTQEITKNCPGYVRIMNETWPAICFQKDIDIKKNSIISVTEIQGNKLIVKEKK